MAEREPPRSRGAYATFQVVLTRWNDNDQYGHVYNATYYELFDSAMNDWMIGRGMLDHTGDEPINYVAENGCVYFRQVAYPDRLDIGLRLARIGRSSARLEMGMFRQGEDTESARAHFVLVCVDTATRRPVAFPPRQRDLLASLRPDAD